MNKIFQEVPYDIFYSIFDFIDEDKHYKKAEHQQKMQGVFVDLKNIGAGRYGGSVTAAQFLNRFVPEDTKWAHLDIAGTTWKNSGDIMNNKGSTGFGLTLIADFISKYFKN